MNETSCKTRVALFVTCLTDLFRPEVGFASLRLLARSGAEVLVPEGQTCCGQPAYNSGDNDQATALARQNIALLEGFDAVVVPSGSCAGMIARHYPQLLADDPDWAERASVLAARTHELSQYLLDAGLAVEASLPARAAYHHSCSCLREMGVQDAPRELLSQVQGLELHELREASTCCGFGGSFSVKYPEISTRMADDKIDDILATGADCVLAADLGCLLQLAGRIGRRGESLRLFHLAEVLAGMAEGPGIGGGD